MMVRLGVVLALGIGFAACSSSNTDGASPAATNDGGTPGDDDGVLATDGAASETSTNEPVAIPPPTACPTAKYATVVIVGDSISDVGGAGGTTGQQPFYRTLLVNNDDALYPEWKGFDLATCWMLDPTSGVVKASKGGAVATVPANNSPTDNGILLNQATGLPAALPGPVLVVGTIGGNDVTGGLITVLTGTPAQVQAKIDAFVAGFGAAMTELTKPDRFGPGVKADVLITNIYDPSGGTGHFYYTPKGASCPGALGLWPDNKETKTLLAQWNDAMKVEAAKHPTVRLLELNAPYAPHAVSAATDTNWFYQDCIHPNTAGHNAIRGLFWAGMRALP